MKEKMITKMDFRQWMAERDEAILSFDLEAFKAFYGKWYLKGVYDKPLDVPDKVIEISIRKMALGLKSAPEEKKAAAREWLLAHGYNPEPLSKDES